MSGTGIISSPAMDRLTPPACDSSSPCSVSVTSPELEGLFSGAWGVSCSCFDELGLVAAVLFLRPVRLLLEMEKKKGEMNPALKMKI